jgi:hypothetical protein
MSFFLKPLSVTLPYAARFTDRGDGKPCAKSAFNNSAKAETVTVTKGGRGGAGAVFDLSTSIGAVSDQRAADGEGDGRRQKKGRIKQPNICFPYF